MNTLGMIGRETGRMLRERVTLLFMALTTLGAIWFCLNSTGVSAADAFILNPAKSSAVLGALFFALLTLAQFHRDYKNHTDSIVLCCTDPITHQLRRTLALIITALNTTLAVTLFALPYAFLKTGPYFQADSFAASWYLIFLGSLIFSILFSAGIYMLLRRVDAAFVVVAGFMLLSVFLDYQYELNPGYLLFWVQTNATGFSDLVSNQFQIDTIRWNRLFWLLASLGVWLVGLCALRRYGHGALGSFLINCRRVWLPVLMVAVILLSSLSYAAEPVFDNSIPIKFDAAYNSGTGIMVSFGGQEEPETFSMRLLDQKVDLDIDTDRRLASGQALYKLKNLTGQAQALSILVNPGYTVQNVLVNGQPSRAIRDQVESQGSVKWFIDLPAGPEMVLEVSYSGYPQSDGSLRQVPIDGICDQVVWLSRTGVAPETETEVSKDSRYSCTLTINEHLTPVFRRGEGKKLETVDGRTRWNLQTTGMGGGGLIAAEYCSSFFEAGGLKVEFKYFKKHQESVNEMDAAKVMKAAIDYFTRAYGKLPYEDHLTILELPACFSGGFASGNISAMSENVFASTGHLPTGENNPDSGGGVDVLVHEIAHQWWGLATHPQQDGASNWTTEGLTCYSTYRFMEHYYGAPYAKEHYLDRWEKSWATYKNAFYIQNPDYLVKLSAKDASNVLGRLRSMAIYDLMSLQLLKAEAAVGSKEAFQNGLARLYQDNLNGFITFEQFISTMGLTEEVLHLA